MKKYTIYFLFFTYLLIGHCVAQYDANILNNQYKNDARRIAQLQLVINQDTQQIAALQSDQASIISDSEFNKVNAEISNNAVNGVSL